MARKHRDGEEGGYPIDVLNLSMGYYHETPKDELFDPTMYDILAAARALRRGRGVLGRQRRHRPPDVPGRVLGPWSRRHPDRSPTNPTPSRSPRVGALNPNGYTDALFSNAGPGSDAYAPGAW